MQNRKIYWLFIVLLLYVFAQSLWWLYNIYHLTIEHNTPSDVSRKLWMVLGEGGVFLIILSIGFYITYKSFKKEIQFSNQQRNFLLSITHELKTPIAATKLYLQTLHKRDLDKEKQNDIILKSLDETNRLNDLVENILTVTSLEENAYVLIKEKFNLSESIQNIALKMMETNKRNIDFEFIIQPDVYLNADKNSVQMILVNLIGNAIKYTHEKTAVIISLFEKEGHIAFSISDNGPGIPKEDKDKVFEKFYRIGNENTRKTKGTGLGLFIVKQLVEQNNGTVLLKRNKPSGCIFVCTFPSN